jgi:hypothetical protein
VDVGTTFRDTLTPVLAWDSSLYDELGLTGPLLGTDQGTITEEQLVIAARHVMAAGLTGSVTVVKAPAIFSWGRPAASAAIVARAPGVGGEPLIFAYEKGAPMVGLNAPARRVGFFLENTTASALTLDGWALFDAAVRWVTGR